MVLMMNYSGNYNRYEDYIHVGIYYLWFDQYPPEFHKGRIQFAQCINKVTL